MGGCASKVSADSNPPKQQQPLISLQSKLSTSNVISASSNEDQTSVISVLDLSRGRFDISSVPQLLPTSITRFLLTLDLSCCKLRSIPSEISQCKLLTSLNVSNNLLESLPSLLRELPQLRILNISGNFLKDIPPAILISLTELTELYAANNEIKEPPLIGPCKKLEVFDFRYNMIVDEEELNEDQAKDGRLRGASTSVTIPSSITGALPLGPSTSVIILSKVSHILLRSNRLKTLTWLLRNLLRTGSQCPLVTSLDISHNKLYKVSNHLFFILNNLESLNCSFNNLTMLESDIGLLSSLRHLNMSHNKLSVIDEVCFDRLSSLLSLDLSYNCLATLPSLRRLKNLKNLNLKNNILNNYIVDELSLSVLEELNLSQNLLKTFPSSIACNCIMLKSLVISSNGLQNLPDTINQLKFLSYLDISDNLLSSLPSTLAELPHFKGGCNVTLLAGYNRFDDWPCVLNALCGLTNLDLSGNPFRQCHELDVAGLGNLRRLLLSHTYLPSIPMKLALLTNLSYLYLYPLLSDAVIPEEVLSMPAASTRFMEFDVVGRSCEDQNEEKTDVPFDIGYPRPHSSRLSEQMRLQTLFKLFSIDQSYYSSGVYKKDDMEIVPCDVAQSIGTTRSTKHGSLCFVARNIGRVPSATMCGVIDAHGAPLIAESISSSLLSLLHQRLTDEAVNKIHRINSTAILPSVNGWVSDIGTGEGRFQHFRQGRTWGAHMLCIIVSRAVHKVESIYGRPILDIEPVMETGNDDNGDIDFLSDDEILSNNECGETERIDIACTRNTAIGEPMVSSSPSPNQIVSDDVNPLLVNISPSVPTDAVVTDVSAQRLALEKQKRQIDVMLKLLDMREKRLKNNQVQANGGSCSNIPKIESVPNPIPKLEPFGDDKILRKIFRLCFKNTQSTLHHEKGVGADVAIALVCDRTLHVANVGAAGCLLIKNTGIGQLINPCHSDSRWINRHSVTKGTSERRRIHENGGYVMISERNDIIDDVCIPKFKIARIKSTDSVLHSTLSVKDIQILTKTKSSLGETTMDINECPHVSRSFGLLEFSPTIVSLPSIRSVPLASEDWFAVTSCNGLFDVLNAKEIGRIVLSCVPFYLDDPHTLVMIAAAKLRNMAYLHGCKDDINVIVTDVRPHDWYKMAYSVTNMTRVWWTPPSLSATSLTDLASLPVMPTFVDDDDDVTATVTGAHHDMDAWIKSQAINDANDNSNSNNNNNNNNSNNIHGNNTDNNNTVIYYSNDNNITPTVDSKVSVPSSPSTHKFSELDLCLSHMTSSLNRLSSGVTPNASPIVDMSARQLPRSVLDTSLTKYVALDFSDMRPSSTPTPSPVSSTTSTAYQRRSSVDEKSNSTKSLNVSTLPARSSSFKNVETMNSVDISPSTATPTSKTMDPPARGSATRLSSYSVLKSDIICRYPGRAKPLFQAYLKRGEVELVASMLVIAGEDACSCVIQEFDTNDSSVVIDAMQRIKLDASTRTVATRALEELKNQIQGSLSE